MRFDPGRPTTPEQIPWHPYFTMLNSGYEDRVALTRAIMHILDGWGLDAAEQMAILSLPKGTPSRALRRYRDNTPFPEDAGVMERIEHLVGIADALRTSYPHNPQMGAYWVNQPNRRFDDRTPRTIMTAGGLSGIVAVRSHLDCAFDQDEHLVLPGTGSD
ncbi:MAG: DUF2384 domain-containing protein [Pseudomonadota bacterium]|nr:MAG: DUF2384 domain-containing protein [Pseudomonadota bacterium]